MAKRRTKLAVRRAKKKADKLAGMNKPKGQSQYALKKAGQIQKKLEAPRQSWFQRIGLAAQQEQTIARMAIHGASASSSCPCVWCDAERICRKREESRRRAA